ncbi:hypothetical protein DEJ15_06625 [Curtobacterium sp. MCJR17_043]|nr:hypothetical protein [Curtobacterium sp. MCJR17_043]WIB36719.1 hypothetical protein DEJ15_06625 [Curtobacterium sp. MCJR17_043]
MLDRTALAEDPLRLTGQLRVDDDLVRGGEHLVDAREVPLSLGDRERDDAVEHAEPGTDDGGGEEEPAGLRREERQHDAEEEPEPEPGQGARECCSSVGHLAGHALDGLEVVADDGQLRDREVRLRELRDHALCFGVAVVGAEDVTARQGGERLCRAAAEGALSTHPVIIHRSPCDHTRTTREGAASTPGRATTLDG